MLMRLFRVLALCAMPAVATVFSIGFIPYFIFTGKNLLDYFGKYLDFIFEGECAFEEFEPFFPPPPPISLKHVAVKSSTLKTPTECERHVREDIALFCPQCKARLIVTEGNENERCRLIATCSFCVVPVHYGENEGELREWIFKQSMYLKKD